jgi:hypothetical protein
LGSNEESHRVKTTQGKGLFSFNYLIEFLLRFFALGFEHFPVGLPYRGPLKLASGSNLRESHVIALENCSSGTPNLKQNSAVTASTIRPYQGQGRYQGRRAR